VFDDTKDWWFDCDEHACTGEHEGRYQPGWYSVNVPKTGTQIEVTRVRDGGRVIEVEVRPVE
jgi:immune inhibitor A